MEQTKRVVVNDAGVKHPTFSDEQYKIFIDAGWTDYVEKPKTTRSKKAAEKADDTEETPEDSAE